jgi:hypothetical protein
MKLRIMQSLITCRFGSSLLIGFLMILTAGIHDAGASLPFAAFSMAAAAQADQLPPVPKEAEAAYFRAWDIIERLDKRPDKAIGSPEWDVAIKRLMEAQAQAPSAPVILKSLGLAHQYRGRNCAAIAWLKAATLAIRKVNAESPQIGEIAKRIDQLRNMPKDQIELALTFARGEIPRIHAKSIPDSGVKGDLWPIRATPPLGPIVIQLPNGQWGQNPDLFNKDGSAKVLDIPKERLEEFLIELRLGIGDTTAIAEAEKYWKAHGSSPDSQAMPYLRGNAITICLKAMSEAGAWPEVIRLAGEAVSWCDGTPAIWAHSACPRFRELKQQASENPAKEKRNKLTQWVELAKDLAKSDDEVYLQDKIDGLHNMTEKGEMLLEGIARAIRPIGHNLLRLKSIEE